MKGVVEEVPLEINSKTLVYVTEMRFSEKVIPNMFSL